MNLIKPSFSTGYAKNASESANPNLWKGLVGAWMPSFGVTGNTLKDVSGNGNDGTLTNMDAATDWVGTSKGLALDFDGVDDSVRCSGIKELNNTNELTVCYWCKKLASNRRVLVGSQISGTNGFWLQWENNNRIYWNPRNGFSYTNSYVLNYTSEWFFLCGTYNGRLGSNGLKAFANGNELAPLSTGTPPSSLSSSVGNIFEIGNLSWVGFYSAAKISNVTLYNRALSPSEIKQLYLNPSAPLQKKTTTVVSVPVAPPTTTAKAVVLKKPKPSYATGYARNASESANPNLWKGLVGAWMPSFGVTGNTLKDVSGNGNDGTLTNMDAASDWVGTSKGRGLEFGYLTNESIQVDSSSLSSSEGSFFCWYKRTSAMANQRDAMLFTGFTSSSIRNFLSVTSWFTANGQPVVLPSFNVSGPTRWVVGPPVYLNEWMHFGYDWSDGKPMRLWVNGRFYGQTSGLFVDYGNYSSVKIGNYSSLSLSASGVIADAFSYNRALSPTEIKQLYLNPSAPFERKQQTVGISTAQAFNPYWANQATQLAGTLQ